MKQISADKLGIYASMLCMVHCIAIPLLLIFGLESLRQVIDQEWVEAVLVLSSLLIGTYSFVRGYLFHRAHFVLVLFVAGFLLLINGEALANQWSALGLSIAGATIIAYAHIQNLRLKQHSCT